MVSTQLKYLQACYSDFITHILNYVHSLPCVVTKWLLVNCHLQNQVDGEFDKSKPAFLTAMPPMPGNWKGDLKQWNWLNTVKVTCSNSPENKNRNLGHKITQSKEAQNMLKWDEDGGLGAQLFTRAHVFSQVDLHLHPFPHEYIIHGRSLRAPWPVVTWGPWLAAGQSASVSVFLQTKDTRFFFLLAQPIGVGNVEGGAHCYGVQDTARSWPDHGRLTAGEEVCLFI